MSNAGIDQSILSTCRILGPVLAGALEIKHQCM